MTHHRIIFLAFGLLLSYFANSQDFQLSQFNNAPLNLNPALTGALNGTDRIGINYRNQWPQLLQGDSYQTYVLSYDHRTNLKSGDFIGLGINGFTDVAGSARFRTSEVSMSLSYAKIIATSATTSHAVIFGLQMGPAQPGGTITNPDFLFFNVNSGLFWVSRFGERKSIYAGVGAFHINSPNISFQTNSVLPISIKYSFNAGGELPLSSKLSLLPSLLYLNQGQHAQLNVGTMLSASNLSFASLSNIQAGLFYRMGQQEDGALHPDALIAALSFQIKGIQLGLSYDHTISDLNINPVGAIEVSVGYIFGATDKAVSPFQVPKL